MSHRTQITLSDEQYKRLKRESAESGLSIAELIRRRLDGPRELSIEEKRAALEASFGAWKDRDFDGKEYVEALRPGLGQRFKKLGL